MLGKHRWEYLAAYVLKIVQSEHSIHGIQCSDWPLLLCVQYKNIQNINKETNKTSGNVNYHNKPGSNNGYFGMVMVSCRLMAAVMKS